MIETNGFQFRDQRNNIDSKQLFLYLGHFDCCPVLSKKIKEPEGIYTTLQSFNIEDEVLVKAETKTKDTDRYEGLYKVVEKIHDRRYLLQQNDGKTIQRNVEKLRTFLKEGGCEY